MANNTQQHSEDPGLKIESALSTTELFLQKNGKKMLIALTILVVAIGGYFAYKHLYQAPKIEQAAQAMFMAQNKFEQSDFSAALNGSKDFMGFAEIASKYSSQPQGNLANHYAGICYLNMAKYAEALASFSAFKSEKGIVNELLTAQNYGLTGDTYVEMGNMAEGVQMYEKAVATSDNDDTAPKYLKKAAMVNVELGNIAQAIEQYRRIKTDYATNFLARDIDKYIAVAEQKL